MRLHLTQGGYGLHEIPDVGRILQKEKEIRVGSAGFARRTHTNFFPLQGYDTLSYRKNVAMPFINM